MGQFINLVGKRFGRLVVVKRAPNKGRQTMWLCRCDCDGNEKVVQGENLKRGATASCGCIRREVMRAALTTHGLSHLPEHTVWSGMMQRCYDPNSSRYHRYGGRGVKVRDRWHDFANFYADMGSRPSPEHEIHRINKQGNYEPDNCVWVHKSRHKRLDRPTHCKRGHEFAHVNSRGYQQCRICLNAKYRHYRAKKRETAKRVKAELKALASVK